MPGVTSPVDHPPQLVLLPGLHGSAALSGQLLAVVPREYRPIVIEFPQDRPLGYDALFELIQQRTRDIDRMIVLGESFSGPLAVRLADAAPDRVVAMVLAVTFVTCPVPRWFARLSRILARFLPTARFQIRALLAGWDAPAALVTQVQHAIATAERPVLAERIAAVSRLDDSDILARTHRPLLYLQGQYDKLIRPHNAAVIHKLRPDATIHTLPTTHLLLQTAPQQAWCAIQKFAENIGSH
jgi:pimeloyl-ACP methyl ester carboxylesterase